jgi:hypothetical protein
MERSVLSLEPQINTLVLSVPFVVESFSQ